MAKCCRHFNALMRKNFILWLRSPCCSIFEFVAPVLLMAALWFIRHKVPSYSVTQEGMLDKKYPTFPGVGKKENGDWCKDTSCDAWMDNAVRPLFTYADYTEKHQRDTGGSYDTSFDWRGPQFWAPGHCIRTTDWASPKKSSPFIGMIGAQTNMTDMIGDYYIGLKKTQLGTAAKFAVPKYKIVPYDTEEEFNDYISSPDYKANRDNQGVCFGM